MPDFTAADKINSAEECQKQEYYTSLMKAMEVSDIGSAYILLQLHFQKYSNMSDTWWEIPNSACKSYIGMTVADMFRKHAHGKLCKMVAEYKPLYENSTATPHDIAVKECYVKSLNTFLDCVDLDEKLKTRMVNNAYTYFFRHKFNQIFTKSVILMVKRLLELGANVNGGPSVFPLSEATRAGSYSLVKLLCQHGADFNKTGAVFAHPPLSIAAAGGRYDLAELMLKFGANSHDKTLQYSPADLAFVHGHIDCARLLVQHGANIDIEIALPSIINYKCMKRLNFMFEHFRYETQQYILQIKHDLLMLAVSEANVEIVSRIFDIGFGITGEHPCLEKLLAWSRDGEIAQFLLQKGADVNKIITCGSFTPLYMVLIKNMCLSSRLQVVQVLLENGASPNIHGDISPLMLAALHVDSTDLLQLLLDHGADFNWRDTDGDTAFLYSLYQDCQCATSRYFFHVRCPIKNYNGSSCVVQKRLHRNAEFLMRYAEDKDFLNAQNSDGLTALMQAVRYSNVAVVSEMINQGSDVNMTDNNGNTALLYAIDRFNTDICNYMAHDIVACLVRVGCSINLQNNDGISPLMLATNRCSCKVVKLLLDAGADVNAVSKTDRSKTALSYFQYIRYSERRVKACLSQLLLQGACVSYLRAGIFHRILLCNDLVTINKYFTNGVGPISVRSDKYFNYFSHTDSIFDISPLCTALIGGNISLAHHFIEMMFLTKSDLSSLMYNKVVRANLEGNNHRQCLDLLDEMSSQPVSLLKLAFVTVSSAVGTSPGRENRVNMLPLPRIMKDKLLFKSPVDLTTPITSSPIDFWSFDPDARENINLSNDCKCCLAWKLKKQHGIHCL